MSPFFDHEARSVLDTPGVSTSPLEDVSKDTSRGRPERVVAPSDDHAASC
jgi:hypothetical protein